MDSELNESKLPEEEANTTVQEEASHVAVILADEDNDELPDEELEEEVLEDTNEEAPAEKIGKSEEKSSEDLETNVELAVEEPAVEEPAVQEPAVEETMVQEPIILPPPDLPNREDDEVLKKPPHSSEIFLGGIPRSLTQEELEELCAAHGAVYEIRLLKDLTSGQNRGYAFVTFTTRESAANAIKALNGTEMKGKKGVRVSLSDTKHRLFVGNLPKTQSQAEVLAMLKLQEPGLESLELPMDPGTSTRNRGFAFCDFYNTASAERARTRWSDPTFKVADKNLTVRWAEPKGEVPVEDSAKVKAIFVRGLPEGSSEDSLRELFEHHGEIEKVMLPQNRETGTKRDFGFVHFKERESALAAAKVETVEFNGKNLDVCIARPQTKPGADGKVGERDMKGVPPHRGGHFPPRGAAPMTYGYGGGYNGGYGGGYGGMEPRPVIDGWGAGAGYGGGMVPMSGPRGYMAPQGNAYAAPATSAARPAPMPASAPPAAPGGSSMGNGMSMVPMMLPNGQVGYVLQQAGSGRGTTGGSSGGGSGSGGTGGDSRRSSHSQQSRHYDRGYGSDRRDSDRRSSDRDRRYRPY